VLDGAEISGYGSNPLDSDTDNDACADGTEAGSINGDRNQNVIDLMLIATHPGPQGGPNYVTGFDVNRNGEINVIDILLSNKGTGMCPPS
jgi:hypothetical protein